MSDTYNCGISSFAIESAVFEYGGGTAGKATSIRAILKNPIKAFRGRVIPDPFDDQNNLVTDVASLD